MDSNSGKNFDNQHPQTHRKVNDFECERFFIDINKGGGSP